MPPKACCCKCYTYLDEFVRETSDASELEPDWETCGVWTDWTLDTGYLKSVVNGSPLVLKHMVGNPYGILEGKWFVAAEQVYLVHVFYGSKNTPCGAPDFTVRFEWITDLVVNVQILQAGNPTPINEQEMSSPTNEVEWHVCVGKGAIQAGIQGSSTDVFACGTPTTFWFAIESEAGTTEWDWVEYTDHFEHNRKCPRCSRRCFGGFGTAIAGFHVEITGIENGSMCVCESSLIFDVYIQEGSNPCLDELTYYIGYTDDPPTSRIAGPHDCGEAASDVIISLTCDAGGIGWSMTLDPDDNGQGEVQWNKSWPLGTNPTDIRENNGLPPYDTGDGSSCNYEASVVTFYPYTVNGCCEEVAPLSTIQSSEIRTKTKVLPRDKTRWIKWVEAFRYKEDKGVGDTVERLLAKIGGRSIKKILMHLGQDCGCTNRQKWLNARYPYE